MQANIRARIGIGHYALADVRIALSLPNKS
jgi:hypothetical protein